MITLQQLYYWNFRKARNVKLRAEKRSEHRPEFVHCRDANGKEFVVHEGDLSEEMK